VSDKFAAVLTVVLVSPAIAGEARTRRDVSKPEEIEKIRACVKTEGAE
jgi:hypothetical protein